VSKALAAIVDGAAEMMQPSEGEFLAEWYARSAQATELGVQPWPG